MHCSPFLQRRVEGGNKGGCSSQSRSGRCGPERGDVEDNENHTYESSSNSLFFVLNNTGESVSVSHSRFSENKSIGNNQCAAFYVSDLQYLDFTPSECSWNCGDLIGCVSCPTEPGYYVMDLEIPADFQFHPSWYSGFEKTDRQAGDSSCSGFRFN